MDASGQSQNGLYHLSTTWSAELFKQLNQFWYLLTWCVDLKHVGERLATPTELGGLAGG